MCAEKSEGLEKLKARFAELIPEEQPAPAEPHPVESHALEGE